MSKLIHKAAHLTSVHPRYDTRIFIKMCSSLANYYDVYLVVADGLGDEIKNKVNIVDVGEKSDARLSRMTKTVCKVFKKAIELDVDIYHLHDPELIPIGLKLKKLGKIVIFDSHEDTVKALENKPYLNPPLRILILLMYKLYEKYACRKFDAIITATPSIREKFLKINPNSININNFPLLDELSNKLDSTAKKNKVAYIGYISKVRGIENLVEAMFYTNSVKLCLVGEFDDKNLKKSIKLRRGWEKIKELGFLSRERVREILAHSQVGIITFLPAANHIESQPNKLFEYMSASIPVVCSNFPLWREIVEKNQCGLCVNPLNSKDIGEAIQYLVDNPQEAKKMGKNGRKVIEEKYNWVIEEKKLLNQYIKFEK